MMATVDLRVEDGKLIVRGPRLGKTKCKYKLEDLMSDVTVGLRLWEGGRFTATISPGKAPSSAPFPSYRNRSVSGE